MTHVLTVLVLVMGGLAGLLVIALLGVGYLLVVLGWAGAEQAGWVHTDLVPVNLAWLLLTASLLYSTVLARCRPGVACRCGGARCPGEDWRPR